MSEENTEKYNAIDPEYYRVNDAYEPWKIIDAYGLDFYLGNALKYVLRAGRKPDNSYTQDLKKAIKYLEHAVKRIDF